MADAAIVPPEQQQRAEAGLSFDERLARRALRHRSCLCVGIDPSPEACALVAQRAPAPGGAQKGGLDARTRAAAAIERFSAFVIDAARDHAPAVKFQLAWFELAGVDGMRALQRSVQYARGAGLLVVLDGKRGDVPHSAAAYARAYLGVDAESGIGGDALTVNGAIGRDALEQFATVARERAAQAYVLVHTSNPGAGELQAAAVGTAGEPWWHLLAGIVDDLGLGAVIGATQTGVLRAARQRMPRAALLVPGVGAQGGAIDDLAPLASPGAPPTLVNASRSLLPPAPLDGPGFRAHVSDRCAELAAATAALLPPA